MKVLWICQFSNPIIRSNLKLSSSFFEQKLRKIFHFNPKKIVDSSVWITNGIKEFENLKGIELHVVSPHPGLSKNIETFKLNGIYYYFFKQDTDLLINKIRIHLFKKSIIEYKKNTKAILIIIERIKPDIIHLFGAENPEYALSVLKIDTKYNPLIVSLQTLLSDIDFMDKYPIADELYNFRSRIEQQVLRKAKYFSSSIQKYRDIIWKNINPEAIFFNSSLAVEQKVKKNNNAKKYDFVFFSASITKGGDDAVESFAIAQKKYPGLRLNIIGDTSNIFLEKLKKRIKELGIERNVFFNGQFPTHDDVMQHIQLSKYALLPLKIDHISSTIREAMFSGLPVVSNITSGTPTLNKDRESILLSEQGDIEGMANNMVRLIDNPDFADKIANNAFITVSERYNNKNNMLELLDVYYEIISYHNKEKSNISKKGTTNPYIR